MFLLSTELFTAVDNIVDEKDSILCTDVKLYTFFSQVFHNNNGDILAKKKGLINRGFCLIS